MTITHWDLSAHHQQFFYAPDCTYLEAMTRVQRWIDEWSVEVVSIHATPDASHRADGSLERYMAIVVEYVHHDGPLPQEEDEIDEDEPGVVRSCENCTNALFSPSGEVFCRLLHETVYDVEWAERCGAYTPIPTGPGEIVGRR